MNKININIIIKCDINQDLDLLKILNLNSFKLKSFKHENRHNKRDQ